MTGNLVIVNAQTFLATLPQPPEVRAKNHVVSLTLHAVNENGRDALAFDGGTVALVIPHPAWLDTVNVPYGSSVDVILDFTDPVIKGMAVFHCHLLNHEDKGMMAKILFK